MVEGDLDRVSVLAAELVRLHHRWDSRRFFLAENLESGYRWWLGSQLERDDTLLIVAEEEGAIAGYLYASLEERDWALLLEEHAAIHDIFVDARFRRRGVAKALMLEGIRLLEARGARRVVLGTATQNEAGQALFASLGFRPTMIEMTRDREP
jgi:ribosomal protein S18 acetylase RimI-like enzyme